MRDRQTITLVTAKFRRITRRKPTTTPEDHRLAAAARARRELLAALAETELLITELTGITQNGRRLG